MHTRYFLTIFVGALLVLVTALSACSPTVTQVLPVSSPAVSTQGSSAPSKTEIVANTPVPSATATLPPTAAATETVAPTAVATTPPTVAVTPSNSPAFQSGAQVVPSLNAYCRKGPGTNYDSISFLDKGTSYNVLGQDGLGSWWLVLAPGNVHCWVGNANVSSLGAGQVAVVQGPPLPSTPGGFVNSFVCDTSLKTFSVALNWASVAYATGYRIFRDGNEIIEVGATVTSYSDKAPVGSGLVYELEAFNDYGVSARTSTSVPACK
jgi:hypothetical protein